MYIQIKEIVVQLFSANKERSLQSQRQISDYGLSSVIISTEIQITRGQERSSVVLQIWCHKYCCKKHIGLYQYIDETWDLRQV